MIQTMLIFNDDLATFAEAPKRSSSSSGGGGAVGVVAVGGVTGLDDDDDDDDNKTASSARRRFATADAAFSEIKKKLGVPPSTKSVPFDDDFVVAFEVCFDVDFDDLGDESRVAFQSRLGGRGKSAAKGVVTAVMWEKFFKRWHKSDLSMEDYLKTLVSASPP